jgi:hypothetical protein
MKGKFGVVHCVKIPHYGPGIRAFPYLHSLCANTPCNIKNFDVDSYITPNERSLINRTKNQSGKILMSKTADGMLFHIKGRLIGGMHGTSLYNPKSSEPVNLFSIQDTCHTHTDVSPIKIVFHDGICDPHEVSRLAITKHVLHQLLALKPPCPKGEPHVIFKSPNLGTFSTRVVKGPLVHSLKLNFLQLIQQMAKKGGGVYNQTIRLKPEFSKLLMLKNSTGNILCDRCVDGLVGYRIRPSTQKKTFVFVANSNDFHADSPCHPNQSMLQVMKLDYADTSKNGTRVIVHDPLDDIEDADPYPYEDEDFEEEDEGCIPDQGKSIGGIIEQEPSISLGMTVQQMVNTIESHFRGKHLKEHSCECFPLYDKAHREWERQNGVDTACDLMQSRLSLAGG